MVYITPTILQILKKHKSEQDKQKLLLGNKWQNSNRVFTTDYGRNIYPDTPSKILEKLIKKYDLKRITFHGLRHTSISLQITSGIQSQIISKRVGHSSIAVTHNIYSHLFNNVFKKVADKMDSLLQIKSI